MLSLHLVGELARGCDHLVVIRDGRVRLAGELDQLLSEHYWAAGPPDQTARMPAGVEILSRSRHQRHNTQLVGAVHPRTRFAERVGHEPLSCLRRPVQVSPGQTGTGEIELSGGTYGYRVQAAVENVDPHVVQRTADRHRVGHQLVGTHSS